MIVIFEQTLGTSSPWSSNPWLLFCASENFDASAGTSVRKRRFGIGVSGMTICWVLIDLIHHCHIY